MRNLVFIHKENHYIFVDLKQSSSNKIFEYFSNNSFKNIKKYHTHLYG